MTTASDDARARASKSQERKDRRATRRRRDRTLAPVTAAQRLGIRVPVLAEAMRAAGVTEPITDAAARQWAGDPSSAPDWLSSLLASVAARRQRQDERREMAFRAAGQSALAKLQAGKRRFTDDQWLHVEAWAFSAAKELVRGGPDDEVDAFDRLALRAVDVDPDDHSTWPLHAGGCDGEGSEHCSVRLEELRAARRAQALIDSVAKETALRELGLTPGQFVTTWHGGRVGLVVTVNRVSVKVRTVGGLREDHLVVEKNLDPRYVERAPASLPAPPAAGAEVVLRDHGGHVRRARVLAVDGPLFEASYSLKSGQQRTAWFDLAAIQDPAAAAP